MSIQDDAELKAKRDNLVGRMFDCRIKVQAGHTQADVEECRDILEKHLEVVSAAADRDAAMRCVRTTVLSLNELNEKVGGALIETTEREDICAYIIRTGVLLGFNGENDDVSEEWRDW
jgi:hypothetical protein